MSCFNGHRKDTSQPAGAETDQKSKGCGASQRSEGRFQAPSGPLLEQELPPLLPGPSVTLRSTLYSVLTHIYGILKDGNNNPICKTEKETQMYRTDFWTLWEKARVGCSERTALNQVYYQG